jgi:hypothetical protein
MVAIVDLGAPLFQTPLFLEDGAARSKPLQPGRYLVRLWFGNPPPTAEVVVLASGATALVELRAARGVQVKRSSCATRSRRRGCRSR